MANPDFVIAGGGIIGLSLALELNRRGASVVVLEAGTAARQTSSAAAGMLAVTDPANPRQLHTLAELSASLYPGFLDRIAGLSGVAVPFQTETTLQECTPADPHALAEPRMLVPGLAPDAPFFRLLQERSVDPRQLAHALRAAVLQTSIALHEHTALESLQINADGVRIETAHDTFHAEKIIDCMGSWSPAPVSPRKGQMLAVAAPPGLDLRSAVRCEAIYIVPRTSGPHAGRLIVGATIEDAGFDLSVHPRDILALNARAVRLIPALAEAQFLESWSGLRPSTADGLPILGASAAQPRYVLATGHFRNGILLAPATAEVVAQTMFGEPTSVNLAPFSPERFRAPEAEDPMVVAASITAHGSRKS